MTPNTTELDNFLRQHISQVTDSYLLHLAQLVECKSIVHKHDLMNHKRESLTKTTQLEEKLTGALAHIDTLLDELNKRQTVIDSQQGFINLKQADIEALLDEHKKLQAVIDSQQSVIDLKQAHIEELLDACNKLQAVIDLSQIIINILPELVEFIDSNQYLIGSDQELTAIYEKLNIINQMIRDMSKNGE